MSDPLVLPGAFNVADHFLEPNLTPERSRRPYVLCGDEVLTYGELDRRSRRFASALTRLGVEPENRVMLLLLDTPAFPVAFWGAIRAGAVAVPINTLLSTDDYRFFLADSRAKVLLVDRALWEKAEPALDGHRYLKEVVVANGEVAGRPRLRDLLEAGDPQAETVPMTPGDPAFWLYTSGSTGEPKAAVHLHSHMVAVARSFPTRVLGLRPDDVSFSAAKLFFAFGLGNGLYFPMVEGGTSVLLSDRPTPRSVLATLARYRPTVFYAVPTLFNALLHTYEEADARGEELPRLDHLRFSVSAGESLPPELYRRWRERFGSEILDGIGSTEMLHMFIANAPGRVRPGSSGQVVPGYRARIVDEDGRDVPDGSVGALWVAGGSAAASYWNRRSKTQATMLGEWLVTGDQYHRDEDGYYHHHGRNDDMMKVSGSWVAPVEVERALATHPAVAECAVVGWVDDEGLTKPKAFVVLRSGENPSPELAEALRGHTHEQVAGFKVPRWIEFVADLPKTATGKIRRFELRQRSSEP